MSACCCGLPIPPVRLQLLPLAAGLAAAEAIRTVAGLSIDLRWPNDLLIRARARSVAFWSSRKIEDDRIAFAVVGIGINVHQRSFDPGLVHARHFA